jgi:hypothetical protein
MIGQVLASVEAGENLHYGRAQNYCVQCQDAPVPLRIPHNVGSVSPSPLAALGGRGGGRGRARHIQYGQAQRQW